MYIYILIQEGCLKIGEHGEKSTTEMGTLKEGEAKHPGAKIRCLSRKLRPRNMKRNLGWNRKHWTFGIQQNTLW